MSCTVISQKPISIQYFLLTYYLLTYLLKSNPGNPVPATGYPVPKPVPTSNHYILHRRLASADPTVPTVPPMRYRSRTLTLTAADPRGARGVIAPLDWGQKNFIARRKNTHICKPPFACQNVLKLTHSNLEFQNFPGEDPQTTLFQGRGGKAGEGGEREGKEGGEGEGREGRDGKGQGREGMGAGGRWEGVSGLFAPRYFRSSERKFPLRTFAPGNESSRELMLPGAKVLGNFRSRERKFPGTFAPGIVSSHFFSLTNTVY